MKKILNKIKINAVGADASVRPKHNIKTFDKHKLDVVVVEMPNDALIKKKHTKNPISNFQRPTSNSAITLVALVITIIILLILAGVVLNMVIGENGIIPKAQFSELATNIRQEDERQALEKMNKELEKIGNKNEVASIEERKFIQDTPYTEGIYKVKGNRLDNNGLEDTLEDTIKTIEGIEEITEENVRLYQVDNDAYKKDYILNVVSGKTYQYKALSYDGKYWHRPELGKNKKTGEMEEPEEKEEEKESNLKIEPNKIEIEEGETKNITITYNGEEITTSEVEWIDSEDIGDASVVQPEIEDFSDYEDAEVGDGLDQPEDENNYEDDIISIKNGVVTGETEGTTKVKATYKGEVAELEVTVTGKDALGEVEATEIAGEVKNDTENNENITKIQGIEVNRGKTKTIKVYNTAGKRIKNTKFTWTSGDESIAKVSKKGVVTGISGDTIEAEGKKVTIVGTSKADANTKVECEVSVLELKTFTPTLEIVKGRIKVTTDINKKYGMKYYRYIVDDEIVAKNKAKKYTVKKALEKEATHKVKVRVSNGKYAVISTEEEIFLPQFRFEVEVANINNTGWTQNIKETNGSKDGYTIKYYYTTDETKIGSTEITNGVTSTSATGKSDLTTYYVWARATKTGENLISDNYIELNTGHIHLGNETSGGGCFKGENRSPCYYKYMYSNKKITTTKYSFNCLYCGSYHSSVKTLVGSGRNFILYS